MTMKTSKTSTWRGFRKHAGARAAELEKEAELTRLVAMADDPLDALATLWDVAVFDRHVANTRAARLRGDASPPAPAPVSRLLSGFTEHLRDKCIAVAALLQPDERERLATVTPGFAAAMEANDVDVMLFVRSLLPCSPDVIAAWLRMHIESIEARFAP